MDELIMPEQRFDVMDPFTDPERFAAMMEIATVVSQTSIIPDVYREKPGDCLIAMDMAKRMNVSLMFVMQNLYVVKGKPSWSGQACMTLIKASPTFKDVWPEYIGEENTGTWGCRIRATRRDTGEVIYGPDITIGIVKAEGWFSKKDRYGNETSKWQTLPKNMLAYRAASLFAKIYIPESLMGVYIEGEAEDITADTDIPDIPDIPDVFPITPEAEDVIDG